MDPYHFPTKDEVFDSFLLKPYMQQVFRDFKGKVKRDRPNTNYREIWTLQIELARHIYGHKGQTPADAIEWLLETCLPEALEQDINLAEGTHASFLQEIRDFQHRLGRGEHPAIEVKLTGKALRDKVDQLHREATTIKKKKKVACKVKKLCNHDHSPELEGLWKSFWTQDISSPLPFSMNNYSDKQIRNAYRETLDDLTRGIENGIKIAVARDYDIALETLLTKLHGFYRNSDSLMQAEISVLSDVLIAIIVKEKAEIARMLFEKFPELDIDLVHLHAAIDLSDISFIEMLLECRRESTLKLIRGSPVLIHNAVENKDLEMAKFLLSKGAQLQPYHNESTLTRLKSPQQRLIKFTDKNALGTWSRMEYDKNAEQEYATISLTEWTIFRRDLRKLLTSCTIWNL